MKRPSLDSLTLRQKIGQTGMPGPRSRWYGVAEHGSHGNYFKKYPFAGIYVGGELKTYFGSEEHYDCTPEGLSQSMIAASKDCGIPLFVSCDSEHGAKSMWPDYHRISTMMSVGAAASKELAYQRSYYYAKELKTIGVNWPFSPVCDLVRNFFASSVRCMSDKNDVVLELLPEILRGYKDAGVASTVKHYPGSKGDFRDSHISTTNNKMTLEQWYETYFPIWKKAVESGADSIMVSHSAFPAMDSSYARGKSPRPASASTKMISVLRDELHFDGVILTDAVSMKGVASLFDPEDLYIECFNAGNDLVLFCHDDYIDVMEKAVLDGRVSMERLNESVERILDLKEKLGLFEENRQPAKPLTEEENKTFDAVNYQIAQKAITLINNTQNLIPLDPDKIKKVAIIQISPKKEFWDDLQAMGKAFEERGVEVTMLPCLESKNQLEQLSKENDLIVYACFIAEPFFSGDVERRSLMNGLSHGAEKTVVASFGAPSVYYNYFETVDVYLNAYSSDAGTMQAFVDGILGDFPFTGKSPVALEPEFKT